MKYLSIILLAVFIIVGCSNEQAETNDNDTPIQEEPIKEVAQDSIEEDQEVEETVDENEESQITWEEIRATPAFPSSIEDLVHYPVGLFPSTAEDFDLEGLKEHVLQMPKLEENATEKDLYDFAKYIYSLLQGSKEDPRPIVQSIAMLNSDSPDKIASPDIQKEQYNVLIALDASGSMGHYLGNETRMEIAKAAIKEFAASLPEDANVGLRVYGHEGTGSNSDKELSCSANELLYGFTPYNETELNSVLDPIHPAGWTPLANALELAGKDLEAFAEENSRNIIYFVSDGIETCGGDAVKVGEQLKNLNVETVVNIIGFAVEKDESASLKTVADAAGGTYSDARNQQQLKSEFDRALREAYEWQSWKIKSQGETLYEKNRNDIDIRSWRNRLYLTTPGTVNRFNESLWHLKNHSYISEEQRIRLDEIIKEVIDNEVTMMDEYMEFLLSVNEEDFAQKWEEIENIYNSNTN
ncbi:vWA domain-containing protein [Sutcliffiella sp. NC1]|uniref:vWA domain-containing protein n=1 Tax=Sutcliffiella sp. NC1 TaxID=3004096 RepID=UPI0022DE700C|nr:VWA domain-containing protein [Sutcliffiella sp. NC1]WBL15384.1 VWA domain-containing protein [Sutcliffiella sp. NC1]